MPTTATPVVIDCDNTMGLPHSEIDDGLTIMYLLARPEVRLVGITTTWGNGTVEATTTQTLELVARLGSNVPVHRGAAPPRAAASDATPGSGAAEDPVPPAASVPGEPEPPPFSPPRWRSDSEAARELVGASREHEGRLVVLALGAATNLAGAAELDPGFFERLARIVVMGGYRGPLHFPKREVAELNLSCDPEASERVLHAPCPVTIMSAQLCLWARFGPRHLLLHNRGPRWLRSSVRDWYRTFAGATGARGFYLWDLLPAAFLVEPGRFSAERYELRSHRDDLARGELRLAPASGSDEEPGIVHVPETFERASAFVTEAARTWSATARRASPVHGSE